MKNECGIVEDLLALYTEGMLRPDTTEFVEEHLQACASCRSRLAELRAAPALPAPEAAPLTALRRRVWGLRVHAALCAALLCAALLLSIFSWLTAPQYLNAAQAGVTVQEVDGTLWLTATPAGCHTVCQPMRSADGERLVQVSCWTAPLERWRGMPTLDPPPLPAAAGAGTSVYYCPNDGSEDVLLWGPGLADGDALVTVPRLALGYYLLIAAALTAALGAAWALLRKRPAARALQTLFWLPVCYLLGHLLVKGTQTASYNLPRDFSLIVLAALLLYAAFLLGRALWENRRTQRQR